MMMCECDLRHRGWNPNTGRCERCGCNYNALLGITPQPRPKPTGETPTWELVVRDMKDRDYIGSLKYGTRHQPGNGRDHLQDAYEEALDLCVYLKAAIISRTS